MKNLLLSIVGGFALSGCVGVLHTNESVQQETDSNWDLYSDTWVATDALGRTMPGIEKVGPVKDDKKRTVGIFYITWHSDNLATLKAPYRADVMKILEEAPEARLDANHPLWTEGS